MFLTLLSCCLGRIAAPCAETLYGPPFFSRFFADAQNDIPCHHRRSRRRSEGSGAPHWFSTLAATGDFKGDMHPDDATGSAYHGSVAHISRPSSASGREVAFFSGIGKWRRSRSRFTWGRDSLPELHTIPGFPSIVFHIKLCLSLISHTGFCR